MTSFVVNDANSRVMAITADKVLAQSIVDELNGMSGETTRTNPSRWYRTRRDLYERALSKWGVNDQIAMLHEEIGELLVAVGHYRRGRSDTGTVISEVADVRVMLEQLVMMVGATEDEVDAIMSAKIERLRKRLEG